MRDWDDVTDAAMYGVAAPKTTEHADPPVDDAPAFVPVPEFPGQDPKPSATEQAETKPAEAVAASGPARTHRKECGDVGITGEHGNLGTNAAEDE
jgi:hypothetical protein